MECCCNLRNVHDLLADGKTPHVRLFGEPFKGSVVSFGVMVEYHPVSATDLSRLHQFGEKVPPGMFLGYVLIAGRIWKGDVLVADIEELANLDHEGVKISCSRSQMERQNCLAEITESENPLSGGNNLKGVKISGKNFNKLGEVSADRQKMTLKPEVTSGQSKVTSFIVITSNLGFSSTCRKKKHSQSH